MIMAGEVGSNGAGARPDVDVVVVGAGLAGLYMLFRLRKAGFSCRVLEAGDDVGGTWYWNRYPGARCDIPTTDYTYSFDPELEAEWTWSEKYATQPEILRYVQHVADKHDLRKDIQFSTRVVAAQWDDASSLWQITTDAGTEISCRWFVMATGCLSVPKVLDIDGADRFLGDIYFTSRWPHEGVDVTGKRVGVIGTGSSGIQSIPLMAAQAAQLTVFQRTPNFSIPARNGPPDPARLEQLAADRAGYRAGAKYTRGGVPGDPPQDGVFSVSAEERQRRFEEAWESGELGGVLGCFNDILVNQAANDELAEFLRGKIRSIVNDPETAESLCPVDHPVGTKRPCLDTNYYATFNLPHVRLVDLRKHPIKTITETGIETDSETFEFDVIVFATGFDAMTGALVGVDITGRDGVTLKQKWEHGPVTYLGLTTVGFPNLFTITGPGSPSVLSNMAVSIEQHVDWVSDALADLRARGVETIEPTPTAEHGWVQHVNDCAGITLYPTANSWYMGANVPGKPRVFLPYVGGVDTYRRGAGAGGGGGDPRPRVGRPGGVDTYRRACDEVVARDYLGFVLDGPNGSQCNDGVIRRLQPDVAAVLDLVASLDLPPLESLPVDDARAFVDGTSAQRPPGPEVSEIVDGTYPAAAGAGDLRYRLYRPEGAGPHPVIVYFHGGGWVLGSHDSDDPFCRDLCVRTGSVVVSLNYRHGPEDRFPAAADDAFAALRWVAEHAIELGGIPGQLSVAGWSAGGNLAAVVSQLARDAGGPDIKAQLLLTPVTDADFSRQSYVDNADGYVLTTSLMKWFWDHYAAEGERSDPKASPLRAASLAGLPPAVIVTAEFDPLRDEGDAYAAALAEAGVPVHHLRARGHTNTSLTMVDVILSGAAVRAEMADALRA